MPEHPLSEYMQNWHDHTEYSDDEDSESFQEMIQQAKELEATVTGEWFNHTDFHRLSDENERLREALGEVLRNFACIDPARDKWAFSGLVDGKNLETYLRALEDA